MKEITGIFSNKSSLDEAFEKLKLYGVSKDDISLLATEKQIKRSLGTTDYASVLDLRDRSDLPRISYISEKSLFSIESIFITFFSYVGIAIAVTFAIFKHKSVGFDVAIGFTVGLFMNFIALVISGIIRKRHGDYIERKLDKGGLLFWVKVRNRSNVRTIYRCLKESSAQNLRVIST